MQNTIQIVFCTDMFSIAGLFVTLQSIYKNCSDISRLTFYGLCETVLEKQILDECLTKYFPSVPNHIEILKDDHLNKISSYTNFCKDNPHCRNTMNFARFLLPDIFQSLEFFLYIDTDFLVLDDVCKLWSCLDGKNNFYAVPSEASNKIIYSLAEGAEDNIQLSRRRPFNAGISIIDAREWRKSNTTEELIGYMNNELLQKSFRYGTQPLLNYKFQQTYTYLPSRWNRIAYDYSHELHTRTIDLFINLSEKELRNAGISAVHFAGCPKPWVTHHSVGIGNWPSPGESYNKYFPYPRILIFTKAVQEYIDTEQYKLFLEVAENIFGITVLMLDTKDAKAVENTERILSYFSPSADDSESQSHFVSISGKIILNRTDVPTDNLYKILNTNDNKDGIYILEYTNTGIRIFYKNLFEILIYQYNKQRYNKEYLSAILPHLIYLRFI